MNRCEMKVRWGDLGCPTGPCVIAYHGALLIITQTNVDDAMGDAEAVFAAKSSGHRKGTGSAEFVLGKVEFPKGVEL